MKFSNVKLNQPRSLTEL